MNDSEGIRIVSDEVLAGAADIVERHADVPETELAKELKVHALESEIGLPAARSPVDFFRRIVQQIRGRKLIQDLGEREVSVNWLSFHVPPGGKGSLKITDLSSSTSGVGLKLLGLGYGSGRKITMSVNRHYRERKKCIQISHRCRIAVRLFGYPEHDEFPKVQTDLLELLAEEVTEYETCPNCFTRSSDMPPMAAQYGQALDLRGDPVGQSREDAFELQTESETELSLPIQIPGTELTPSLAFKRSIQLSCAIHYDFPGRYTFTPYRRIVESDDLPFWGRS